jgi:hypothetical protein
MTPPISIDSGLLSEAKRRRALQPHLVSSWNIDPASTRLSCVWTVPTTLADADQADRFYIVH